MITEVRIYETNKQNLLAYASITLDHCFVIHGIRLIKGEEKPFIKFPTKKMPDGKLKDIAHPLNTETRDYILQTILEAYNNHLILESI